MNSLILLFHIAAMVTSMVAMSAALVGALFGQKTAVVAAKAGAITAAFGATTGVYLLALHPAALECVVLTSYVAAVALLYRYVFAMGNVLQCGWVRER